MLTMAQTSRYSLSNYVTEIASGLEPESGAKGSGVLSEERAAQLSDRLNDLDLARQRAEAESRDYRLS